MAAGVGKQLDLEVDPERLEEDWWGVWEKFSEHSGMFAMADLVCDHGAQSLSSRCRWAPWVQHKCTARVGLQHPCQKQMDGTASGPVPCS